jgi:hypothetical protein
MKKTYSKEELSALAKKIYSKMKELNEAAKQSKIHGKFFTFTIEEEEAPKMQFIIHLEYDRFERGLHQFQLIDYDYAAENALYDEAILKLFIGHLQFQFMDDEADDAIMPMEDWADYYFKLKLHGECNNRATYSLNVSEC